MTALQLFMKKLIFLTEQRLLISHYLPQLSKDWLVGLIEAEGGVYGAKGQQATFSVSQHLSDWYLIEAIKEYLGAGSLFPKLRKDGRLSVELVVTDLEVLFKVIVPLLSNRLRSQKKLDQFNNWIKTHYNLPATELNITLSKEWVTGFVDGDGSFYISVHKASSYRCGYQVQAVFDIAQTESEKALLGQIGKECFGNTHKFAKSKYTEHIRILKFDAHIKFVEPYFKESVLLSRKSIDFQLWQLILRMMEKNEHLEIEGLNTIRHIRELQQLNRKQINQSIITKILILRPDWTDQLDK